MAGAQGGDKLRVRGLSKSFLLPGTTGSSLRVLDHVDLDVPAGQLLCIVGVSGCGKTTLIKIIDGLIPPDTGTILVNGAPVSGPGRDRGFVFQQDALMPWRTAYDNITFGLRVQGRSRREQEAVAARLIDLVGLQGFQNHYPHQLSGGMRQRVNLARALAVDPDILLMDEPFAALDAQTRETMQEELLRIWSAQKKTVLFITHQIEEAVYLADRVVVLGARPSRVREDLKIDLPRPRTMEMKWKREFNEIARHIWRLIREEARA